MQLEPATVLFADMRDFVRAITEGEQSPEGLSGIADTFGRLATDITEIIFKYGGTLGEFVGDQFVAVFGVPSPKEDDTLRAVAAAIEIQNRTSWIQGKRKKDPVSLSRGGLGIGISTGGPLYVGDVPSPWRSEFAILGSLVNRAARIEELTKEPRYREAEGLLILIDETSYKKVETLVECTELGEASLRSFSEVASMYKVRGWKPKVQPSIPLTEPVYLEEAQGKVSAMIEGIEVSAQRAAASETAQMLREIAEIFSSTLNIDVVLERILEGIRRLLGADHASILLFEEHAKKIEFRAVSPPSMKQTLRNLELKLGQGVVGWTIKEGKPALVSDAQKDERFFPDADKRTKIKTRSIACVPMIVHDKVIGAIEIVEERPDQYSNDDLNLLSSIATSAAIAIRNAQQHELIRDIADFLSSSLELVEVLDHILEGIRRLIGADRGAVLLVNEQTKQIEFKAASPPGTMEKVRDVKIEFGQGVVGWAVANGKPVLVPDALDDARFFPDVDKRTKIETRSIICVPMIVRDKVVGAIEAIDERPNQYSNDDLNLLSSIATSAAIAIQNARHLGELSSLRQREAAGQTLSVLGSFASQIVHSMNNKVGGIRAMVQRLEMTSGRAAQQRVIAAIDKNAAEALTMVGDLRDALRYGEPTPLNLNSAVREVARSFRGLLPQNIRLHQELCARSPFILADERSAREVVRNLIQNSVDALEGFESGDIWLQTEVISDRAVRLSVKDTGKGISEGNKDKIFEVDFTTKKIGKGLGMGLWWVKSYVEMLGGTISFESVMGQSTTFSVELPLEFCH
jgi:GAF domain-containing protein/class 3 adenylate cyclase